LSHRDFRRPENEISYAIKIEPKAFFMYAVFLAFNPVQPDLEDDAIRAYLDEHELIPKLRAPT